MRIFSAMDTLDADDEPLRSSKGVVMRRDIVQFVPFNKFKDVHISGLAKEVLKEVPEQITSYMSMRKLYPLQNKGHLSRRPTMANIYEGPSTLVRTQTQQNVYPDIQQQSQQGVNPHYGQPQVVYVQQGQVPYNPNIASAPHIENKYRLEF
eukprot:TRINITY_DN8877_c0_g1_i1.p1 TRINITY_DN8877_c0_g1~~TRINITY_DN8877_c0_g1_i1.p1  ORF type:complete len:151 (-),score=47.36 TRINITY_DN8877_c0_g1_i1:25-477(-)